MTATWRDFQSENFASRAREGEFPEDVSREVAVAGRDTNRDQAAAPLARSPSSSGPASVAPPALGAGALADEPRPDATSIAVGGSEHHPGHHGRVRRTASTHGLGAPNAVAPAGPSAQKVIRSHGEYSRGQRPGAKSARARRPPRSADGGPRLVRPPTGSGRPRGRC